MQPKIYQVIDCDGKVEPTRFVMFSEARRFIEDRQIEHAEIWNLVTGELWDSLTDALPIVRAIHKSRAFSFNR